MLQILDRSTDIFEVLFVGSAVKYLFNEKPHMLESIEEDSQDEIQDVISLDGKSQEPNNLLT